MLHGVFSTHAHAGHLLSGARPARFLHRIPCAAQLLALPVCALTRPAGSGVCTTALIPIVARFTGIPWLYRSPAEVWLVASAAADPSIAAILAVNVIPHSRCLREAD